MFRIRQRYIDPTTKEIKNKDIMLSLDERRIDGFSSVLMEPIIVARVNGKNSEDLVYLNIEEEIFKILDSKRTFAPRNCYQTFLDEPYTGGNILKVFSHEDLRAFIGCPIAIMSDLNGTNITYTLVQSINENAISIPDKLSSNYHVGAFVQNLSNRWWGYPLKKEYNGIMAKYCMPDSMDFAVKSSGGKIKIMAYITNGLGTATAYDVYVRDKPFSIIEPHWIPDAYNISLNIDNLELTTHGGGEVAGGGALCINTKYYVGIVSKDKIGRVNVNESEPTIEEIVVAE